MLLDPITLPSGANLQVQIAPFAVAKALYQACLREIKHVSLASGEWSVETAIKDLFCLGFSSGEIEECLWRCFDRCTYNKVRIDKDTFESVESRQDYVKVCVEVAKANIDPFVRGLFAEFKTGMKIAESALGSKAQTTI